MNRLQQIRASILALLAVAAITPGGVFLRDTLTLANILALAAIHCLAAHKRGL